MSFRNAVVLSPQPTNNTTSISAENRTRDFDFPHLRRHKSRQLSFKFSRWRRRMMFFVKAHHQIRSITVP